MHLGNRHLIAHPSRNIGHVLLWVVWVALVTIPWMPLNLWRNEPGPAFRLLLGISSDYVQPITGQVTDVTCPVIGRAQPELSPSKRQKTGPGHELAMRGSDVHEVRAAILNAWIKWPAFRKRHFQMNFITEKFCILIRISQKFVPKGPVDNSKYWSRKWLGAE